MDQILSAIESPPDVVDDYIDLMNWVIRVARLTPAELALVDMYLYGMFAECRTTTILTLYDYFTEACYGATIRPPQYWNYIFNQ